MSEEPNLFMRYDYYVRVYDHEKKQWRMANITELSEEEFRRWLLWKLPRLSERRERPAPQVEEESVEKPKKKRKGKQ